MLYIVPATVLFTVPAPNVENMGELENLSVPLKVFESPNRVEDAANIVMFDPPLNDTPLIVRPVCKSVAVPALPVIDPTMVCIKVFSPDQVFESERSVLEALEPPVAERVVPVSKRPEPTVSVFTGETPLPNKIPERVVDPVPPPVGKRVVAYAGVTNRRKAAKAKRSFFMLVQVICQQSLPRLSCLR